MMSVTRLILIAPALAATVPFTVLAAGLEEVVVSAQKREQNQQQVPIAITAFDASEIKNLGLRDTVRLVEQSIGVTLYDTGPSPFIKIRGIGADTLSEALESSVSFYQDEVYRPTLASQYQQLFDTERVEVLRGPQGTLYGRNSNAGLIHIYSARPTEELTGYVEGQAGSYGQFIVEGAVSGPIASSVRGRLSLKSNTDKGYQENQGSGGGSNFGRTNYQAMRGQLEFDAASNVLVRLIAAHSRQRNTASLYGFRGLVDESGVNPCSAAAVLDADCYAVSPNGPFRVGNQKATEGFSEREESDMEDNADTSDLTGIVRWSISPALEFVSVTGYEQLKRSYQDDADGTDFGLFSGTDSGGNPVFAQAAEDFSLRANTLSQEFRLLGSHDKSNWVAGVYYFNDKKRNVDSAVPDFSILASADVDTTSAAAFGQLDYQLSPALTLTGGLRYTYDNRRAEVSTPYGPAVSPGGSAFETFSTGGNYWTYRLGLQWHINDDTMLYANHSTGVKSGEFNVTLVSSADQAAPVGEERISSFETGIKWTFMQGKGRLNGALFYNQLKDYQTTVYETPPGGGLAASKFRNIDDVDVSGLEVELQMTPVNNLVFSIAAISLHSKVKSDEQVVSGPLLPPGFSGGTVYPLDGNELTQAPRLALNGYVNYDIPTDSAGTFSATADFNWQDEVYLSVANDPYNVQEAYGLLNLRAGWQSPNARYYAQLFVENVTNAFYTSSSFSPEGFDRAVLIMGKPRTYGARFGLNF